jgi:ATP-dependent protease ClpP protease subunit
MRVYDGIGSAIHCVLADFTPRKIAYIGSIAAGTATLTMCGCDEIIAGYDSSFIFCHPWGVAYGDADAMHKAAKDLEMITKPIVSVYKAQASR